MNGADEQRKQEEWKRAFDAYGTSYVFTKRAESIRLPMRILTFTGLALPILVGLVLSKFGSDSGVSTVVTWVTFGVGALQVLLSLWSLVAGWNESLAYSNESMTHNAQLSTSFMEVAQARDVEEPIRFNLLKVADQSRRDADQKKGITEKEIRRGMRAALRQFKKACAGCHEVPTSMDLKVNLKSKKCGVCGNY